ncbi:MAG: hypothetical protein IPP22_00565 [Nitrosomonas sp.]|nr:hypothetical protein [Nitrosomonas sp.]
MASERAKSSLGVARRASTKAAITNPKALILRLDVRQSLLSRLKTCSEILQFNTEDRTVHDWKKRLEFMLSSQSQIAFDDVIKDLLLEPALRTPIEFTLPSDKDQQVLVGLAFAEASGTDASEIAAIVGCLVNVAYYARYKEPPRKCFNDSFGDGTILSAIKRSSIAYESAQWKRVMSGDC